jgi:hypothetical protein
VDEVDGVEEILDGHLLIGGGGGGQREVCRGGEVAIGDGGAGGIRGIVGVAVEVGVGVVAGEAELGLDAGGAAVGRDPTVGGGGGAGRAGEGDLRGADRDAAQAYRRVFREDPIGFVGGAEFLLEDAAAVADDGVPELVALVCPGFDEPAGLQRAAFERDDDAGGGGVLVKIGIAGREAGRPVGVRDEAELEALAGETADGGGDDAIGGYGGTGGLAAWFDKLVDQMNEFAGAVDGGIGVGAIDGKPVDGLREPEMGEPGGIAAFTPQQE